MERESIEQFELARKTVSEKAKNGRIAVVFHGDCDGVSSGVIAISALERMNATQVTPMWPDKGQNLYDPVVQSRIEEMNPDLCIVLDMGSRDTRPSPEGIPTVVVDHHVPRGKPDVDAFISGLGQDPVPSASLLTYELFQNLTRISDLDWVAALGIAADYTIDAPFDMLKTSRKKYGRKNIVDAVSLVNSAKRSSAHAVATAYEVIRAARLPADIANCEIPGCERLRRFKQEVSNELRRVSFIPPIFAKPWALIGFSSLAQIHGLVAMKWSKRLPTYRVIAANYGYTPGRVHFSVRTVGDENLIDALLEVGAPEDEEAEFAYGHGVATGGVVSFDGFGEFLSKLGFPPEVHQRLEAAAP